MLTLPNYEDFLSSNNSGIKQSEKDSYSSCQADCLSPMLSTDKACRGNLLILTFMFTVQKEDIYVGSARKRTSCPQGFNKDV